MDSKMKISIDKLPIKRVESLEENGAEHFPPDLDYEEKRVDLIRRIDFAFAVEKEKDAKKQKKAASKDSSASATTPWPWQSLMENLQLAHQELTVILDLIDTVEANDAVTVASMTRPKPLPYEVLSDLSASTATKLQCFRHLGKYFKQSAKAMEQQVEREARFYGALIRLQHNWKVKRLRLPPNAPSNEGFLFDLTNSYSLRDPSAISRHPSNSVIRVEHDSAGMLAVNVTPKSCRYIQFGFEDFSSRDSLAESDRPVRDMVGDHSVEEMEKKQSNDDDFVKETHRLLQRTHRAIFNEHVFELINRGAFDPSLGVNVTGVREDYLRLSISVGIPVFISLLSRSAVAEDGKTDGRDSENMEVSSSPMQTSDDEILMQKKQLQLRKKSEFPNHSVYEIYLQQLFLEYLYLNGTERSRSSRGKSHPTDPAKIDAVGLMSHFCMSLAHRIFANKVHMVLEDLVLKVKHLELVSYPTWHSRTSSWTVSMKDPKSEFSGSGSLPLRPSSQEDTKETHEPLFQARVKVKDDSITIEGESFPNIVGPFGNSASAGAISFTNRFTCDLVDLSMILLFQIASRMVGWLYEEALMLGIKTKRDSLCLHIELDQGETLSLVAHVDPEDESGCISWWLVLDDDSTKKRKSQADISNRSNSETRRCLGYLTLDVLYSTLMDLVNLSSGNCNS